MKRVFYRYELWECYKHGMYKHEVLPMGTSRAYQLLRNPCALYEAMKLVSERWTYSGLMNLSNRGRNRQAWLGQAACCYKEAATEDETKIAWRRLTKEEQDAANAVADRVIKEWETSYAEA